MHRAIALDTQGVDDGHRVSDSLETLEVERHRPQRTGAHEEQMTGRQHATTVRRAEHRSMLTGVTLDDVQLPFVERTNREQDGIGYRERLRVLHPRSTLRLEELRCLTAASGNFHQASRAARGNRREDDLVGGVPLQTPDDGIGYRRNGLGGAI